MMCLQSSAKLFHLPLCLWLRALRLARLYGWEPQGTLVPIGPPPRAGGDRVPRTRGCYCRCQGQFVERSDARALALALEKALPDIPDFEAGRPCAPYRRGMSLFELFSGKRKECLRALVGYCQSDGFVIKESRAEAAPR